MKRDRAKKKKKKGRAPRTIVDHFEYIEELFDNFQRFPLYRIEFKWMKTKSVMQAS